MSTSNGSDYDQATVLTADEKSSSDTTSETGSDHEMGYKNNKDNIAPPVKGIVVADSSSDGDRANRKKNALIVLIVAVLCLVALVTAGVLVAAKGGCNKKSTTTSSGILQDGATIKNDGDEEDIPFTNVTQEEDDEGKEKDEATGEADDLDDEGIEEPGNVEWETAGLRDPTMLPVPLLSLGNFSGMGSSIVVSMLDFPSVIYFGDPDSGCVTAMKQKDGWDLAQMWFWRPENGDEPPSLDWEQVGEPICPGGAFGTQVGLSTNPVELTWNTILNPQSWADALWGNNSMSFVASDPTKGTLSIYSYNDQDGGWALKQTIETPEGYELESFHSEDDYIAVSYGAKTSTAVARSKARSLTDANVVIYRYDSGSYVQVSGEDSTFSGVDVDTDDRGSVVTLGEDRSVRAYHRQSSRFGAPSTNYTQVGPAFKPALVLNDASVPEEDLTIVKCDGVDVVLTASVVDTGAAGGNKTIGIGTYTYRDPDDTFPCLGTPYFPSQCDEVPTDTWDPSYHGAVEFEPNPTEEKPMINFNPKGSIAAVATKTGFKVIFPFEVTLPFDFDLGFDPATYEAHELVDVASFGVVSVLIKSTDGTQEIQTYMMAGC